MALHYDSETFTVSYESDISAALVIFKKYRSSESFRVALMQAAEFLRKNRCHNLIVECREEWQLTGHDIRWMKKIFLRRLDRIGCRKIILILGKDTAGTYPKYFCKDRITVLAASGMEEAFAMAKEDITDNSESLQMTKEEALKFMGLGTEAKASEIDDRFWQMSKVYTNDRSMDPDEKARALDELSDVYDIASGRKAERDAEKIAYANEKKFFGKSAREWKTYIYYSWYKYVIAIVALMVASNLVYTVFFRPKIDCGVFSAGHFYYEETCIMDMMKEDLGFLNPYINAVDVAVPNDQGQVSAQYADQIAVTGFMSNPNVFITDQMSVMYYFDEMGDCSGIYEQLRNVLTEEQFAKITPVYMNAHDAYDATAIYTEEGFEEEIPPEDYEERMVGLMVTDEAFINSLGYYNLWPESEPTLVFTIYPNTTSVENSERILTEIFKRL